MSVLISVRIPQIFFPLTTASFGHFMPASSPVSFRIPPATASAATMVSMEARSGRMGGRSSRDM